MIPYIAYAAMNDASRVPRMRGKPPETRQELVGEGVRKNRLALPLMERRGDDCKFYYLSREP